MWTCCFWDIELFLYQYITFTIPSANTLYIHTHTKTFSGIEYICMYVYVYLSLACSGVDGYFPVNWHVLTFVYFARVFNCGCCYWVSHSMPHKCEM